MKLPIKSFVSAARVMIVALLTCAIFSPARAVNAALVASAQQQTPNLQEIWVRGKALSNVIADAEDDFFRLYNKRNEQDRLDIRCGHVKLDRDSLAMSRTCLPRYLAAAASYTGSLNVSMGSRCMSNAGFTSCNGYGDIRSGPAYVSQSANLTTRLHAGSLALTGEDKRLETIQRLARAMDDQQLMEKAGTLAALHEEMDSIQGMYVEARADADARMDATGRAHSAGIRSGPRP
jgi:hypothetical protein